MPGEVHVWLIDLDGAGAGPAEWAVLAADERARAEAYRFDHLRRRYVAACAAVRRLLAACLGANAHPEALRFERGPQGKPFLTGGDDLQFNLSHAAGWALLAVTRGRRIGVDVEAVRDLRDLTALAERFFAPGERAALAAVAPPLRAQAFTACWTRKEAYIKALGTGLAEPLEQFEVSLQPGAPARLVWVADDAAAPARWTLVDLPTPDGYAGAIAVDGPIAHLRLWRFAPPGGAM